MNKTPHLVIGKKFHLIKDNCIVLSDEKWIYNKNKIKKKMFYDTIKIGKKIVLSQKVPKYMNLKPESTKGNCIYIFCKCKERSMIEDSVFYSESGNLINNNHGPTILNGFILLAIIVFDKSMQTSPILFDDNDIQLVKKASYNQVKQTNSYHFETKGYIYGFGYTVKYDKKQTNRHSYGKYSYSKFLLVKIFNTSTID